MRMAAALWREWRTDEIQPAELAEAVNPEVQPLIEKLSQLQEILGRWNDLRVIGATAGSAVAAMSGLNGSADSRVLRDIERLRQRCQRGEERQIAAFRRWLASWKPFARRNPAKVLFAR